MSENTGKMKIKDVARAVSKSSSESIDKIRAIQGSIATKLEEMRKLESDLVAQAREQAERDRVRELAEMNARESEAAAAEPEKMDAPVVKPETAKKVARVEKQPEATEEALAEQAPQEVAEEAPVAEPEVAQPVPEPEAPAEKAVEAEPEPVAEEQPKPEKAEAPKSEPKKAESKEQTPAGFVRPAERLAQRRGGALRDDAAMRNATRPSRPASSGNAPQRRDGGNRPPQQRRDNDGRPQRPAASGGGFSRDNNRPQGGQGQRPQSGGGSGAAPARNRSGNEKSRVSNYDPNKSNYIRVFDDKRVKNRKQQERERRAQLMNLDDEVMRGRKPRKNKQQAPKPEPIKIEKATITTDTVTVKTLSEKIGKPASEIIKRLLLLGTMATINNEIDFDTAELVANELGVELEHKVEQTAEQILTETAEDVDADLSDRPPVVTIMGHVDHGKTSLLDKIRSSRVQAGEAGGITQHIGAYMVDVNDQKITFLDTPGHEAFTAMRARGAQVTDVVILVVAADDGIMPQTVEAINHAKAAEVPIIVAINKIDKAEANPERVKQELTEHGLVSEEWGGDTVIVPVSAATGEGIDQLLEMILLVSDVQELKANPDRQAMGTIIEAKLDKGRGPVATVLIQNGTLHVGDTIIAGTATGRVRGMLNEYGENVQEATPSQPVEILGLSDVPEAGDSLYATEESGLSRAVAEERKNRIKSERIKAMSKVSLDDLFNQISEGQIKDLNVVVKADVQGSVEAIRQSLEKIGNDEVRVRVIHSGVGAITINDIMLATTGNAIVIGFNVRPDGPARIAADKEHIDIRLYRVIYDAIDDIEKAMKGMLAPVFEEVILGRAEVRETYKVSALGTIAGCYVLDGKITRNAGVRLLRDNVVIYEGTLESLRRFKDDAREVAAGYECGMNLHNYNDIKEGDIIEAFTEQEVEQE